MAIAALGGTVDAADVGEAAAGSGDDDRDTRDVVEAGFASAAIRRRPATSRWLQKSPYARLRQTWWRSASQRGCRSAAPTASEQRATRVGQRRHLVRRGYAAARAFARPAGPTSCRRASPTSAVRAPGRRRHRRACGPGVPQTQDRRPDRHTADEVLRAVDRVDDPAQAAEPIGRESSPSTPGRAPVATRSRIICLTALVTGVLRSGLVSTTRSRALKRSIVMGVGAVGDEHRERQLVDEGCAGHAPKLSGGRQRTCAGTVVGVRVFQGTRQAEPPG